MAAPLLAVALAVMATPAHAAGDAVPPSVIPLGPVVHYTAATAAPDSSAAHCDPHTWSRVDSSQYVFLWDGETHFRDGPGGSMTGTVTTSSTISATITAGAKISVKELVADAELSVSSSITGATTITVGHTYTHNVSAGKYGNLQYGAWGYKLSWSQWYRRVDCSLTKLASGGGTTPTVATGWQYWEN